MTTRCALVALLGAISVLSGCGGGGGGSSPASPPPSPPPVPPPAPSVVDVEVDPEGLIQKGNSTEFGASIDLRNSDPTDGTFAARAMSTSSATVVLDGCVSFGNVPAGQTATSRDTIAISQDAGTTFDPAVLQWTVERITEQPGRLHGFDSCTAAEASYDFIDPNLQIDPAEVSTATTGASVVRTIFEIIPAAGATVADLNTFLDDNGADVVSMLGGASPIAIRIPDPGTIADLETAMDALRSSPFVDEVLAGVQSINFELPPTFVDRRTDVQNAISLVPISGIPPAEFLLRNQIAAGAPEAWNARESFAFPPRVIIADEFGDGSPDQAYDADATVTSPVDANATHGYQVLSSMTAAFNPDAAITDILRRAAQGTFAGRQMSGTNQHLTVSVVDRRAITGLPVPLTEPPNFVVDNKILSTASGIPGNLVLNTSNGATCWTAATCSAEQSFAGGSWASKVRARRLQDRMLHTSSAGNVDGCGDHPAALCSQYNAAALHLLAFPTPVNNLENTLVVEARAVVDPPDVSLRPTAQYRFGCRLNNPPTNAGGTIAAGGQQVFVMNNNSTINAVDGTSYSAPQVAGIAAMMWSIAPQLMATEVRDWMLSTAKADCPGEPPAVDAYEAVLSGDPVDGSPPPVRQAILDINGNRRFEQCDIDRSECPTQTVDGFLDRFGFPADPPDWSRYDLNGDGFTGGERTARFDLDRSGSTQFGAPLYSGATLTGPVGDVTFDETSLTDEDILCYYAYSLLFAGDEPTRDRLLGSRCNKPDMVFVLFRGVLNGDLFVLGPGTAERNLTNDLEVYSYPVLSPDRSLILAGRFDTAVRWSLLLIDSSTGDVVRKVADTRSRGEMLPASQAWSTDSGMFVGVEAKTDPTTNRMNSNEIFVDNRDGTGFSYVTNNNFDPVDPDRKIFYEIALSPDGTKIAFIERAEGPSILNIVIMNTDGTGRVEVTSNVASTAAFSYHGPKWSPDGEKIAFSNRVGGIVPGNISNIFTVNADGSGLTNLSAVEQDPINLVVVSGITYNVTVNDAPAGTGHLAWSPDGNRIAFVSYPYTPPSDPPPQMDIIVVDSDGTGRTNVSGTLTLNEFYPAWERDGDSIVVEQFVYEPFLFQPETSHLARVFLDGSTPLPITGMELNIRRSRPHVGR